MPDNLSHVERMQIIRHTLEHEEEYFYYRYEDDVSYLLQRVAELERENDRLRLDRWDLGQELETRVGELVSILKELPEEAAEARDDATRELTCIEETLKRCGA